MSDITKTKLRLLVLFLCLMTIMILPEAKIYGTTTFILSVGLIFLLGMEFYFSRPPSSGPFFPGRVLSLIVLLYVVGYSAFFLEEDYFANNLLSRMDLVKNQMVTLRLEGINLEADLESSLITRDQISLSTQSNDVAVEKKESLDSYKTLEIEISKLRKKIELNESDMEAVKENYSDLKTRLESLHKSNHFKNNYYVIRAMSLGALGAILTLLASSCIKSREIKSYESLFSEANFWQTLITNSLAGSIVAVVAFALLYTKQISIFTSDSQADLPPPDFWKTTLLCLIAGAFAEKIYQAVASKVDDYVESDEDELSATTEPKLLYNKTTSELPK